MLAFGACELVLSAASWVIVFKGGAVHVYDTSHGNWKSLETDTPSASHNYSKLLSAAAKKPSVGRSSQQSKFAGGMGDLAVRHALVTVDGSVLFFILAGNVYGVPLAAPSSRKAMVPFGGHMWSTSGTVMSIATGEGRGFAGHSNGLITVWNLANGESERVLAGHTGSVMALLCNRGSLYSVSSDGSLREWRVDTGQRDRTWLVGLRHYTELAVIHKGAMLLARSQMGLCIIDLERDFVSHFLLHASYVLAWRESTNASGSARWLHTVTEGGTVASFLLRHRKLPLGGASSPPTQGQAVVPPQALLVPDLSYEIGSSLRSGSRFDGAFAVATLDGRVRVARLPMQQQQQQQQSPPPNLASATDVQSIVRLQARIRRNLARAMLRDCAELRQKQSALAETLCSAAIVEFGHVERLMVVARDIAKPLDASVPSAHSLLLSLKEMADVHLALAKFLAQTAQSWPPVGAFARAYQVLLVRLAKLAPTYNALAISIPSICSARGAVLHAVHGMSVADLAFGPLHHPARMHELGCRLLQCVPVAWDADGALATCVAQTHLLAASLARLNDQVQCEVLRSSYVCDARDWENPRRRVLRECDGEWQGLAAHRVLLCTDAILVVSPAVSTARVSLLVALTSASKRGCQLIECVPLDGLVVTLDMAKGKSLLVESPRGDGSHKVFRFVPPDGQAPDWLVAIRVAAADKLTSRLGLDLRRVLFEEDTNVPVAVASLTASVEAMARRGFLDAWCQQPSAGDVLARGPERFLLRLWRESALPSSDVGVHLLALQHYFSRIADGVMVRPEVVRSIAGCESDADAVERIVASLPQCTQVLLGHVVHFGLRLISRVPAAAQLREMRFFCACFAQDLLGSTRPTSSDWIGTPQSSAEVAALQVLLRTGRAVWRTPVAPEKVIRGTEDTLITESRSRIPSMTAAAAAAVSATVRGSLTIGRRSVVAWNEDARPASNELAMRDSSGVFSMEASRENSDIDPTTAAPAVPARIAALTRSSNLKSASPSATSVAGADSALSASGDIGVAAEEEVTVMYGAVRNTMVVAPAVDLVKSFLAFLERNTSFERQSRQYALADPSSSMELPDDVRPVANSVWRLVVKAAQVSASSASSSGAAVAANSTDSAPQANTSSSTSSPPHLPFTSLSPSPPSPSPGGPSPDPRLTSPRGGTSAVSGGSSGSGGSKDVEAVPQETSSGSSSPSSPPPSASATTTSASSASDAAKNAAASVGALPAGGSGGSKVVMVQRRPSPMRPLRTRGTTAASPTVMKRRSLSSGDFALLATNAAGLDGASAASLGGGLSPRGSGSSTVGSPASVAGSPTVFSPPSGSPSVATTTTSSVANSPLSASSPSSSWTSAFAPSAAVAAAASASAASASPTLRERSGSTSAFPQIIKKTRSSTRVAEKDRRVGGTGGAASPSTSPFTGSPATAASSPAVKIVLPLAGASGGAGSGGGGGSGSASDKAAELKPLPSPRSERSGSTGTVLGRLIRGKSNADKHENKLEPRSTSSTLTRAESGPIANLAAAAAGDADRQASAAAAAGGDGAPSAEQLSVVGEPIRWNSVKLVVVGEENVGKTHLCHQLDNSKYETNVSTDGVDIGYWSTGKGKQAINFITFDFGGQEIFYPTHQLFLTSRCVYMIVFRLDKADYVDRVMYWVRTIEATVKSVPAPPILLVGTHQDSPSVTPASLASMRLVLENLARRYKAIRHICWVSCTKGTGVGALRVTLAALATKCRLAHELVPHYYQDLHDAVQRTGAKEPVMSYEAFRALASSCGVPTQGGALATATKFLHDVGRLMHFEGDARLADMVVLDPGWLADRMTDLISFKQNWPDGIVNMAQLDVIWKNFSAERRDEILSILERFEVVFVKRSRKKLLGDGAAARKVIQRVTVPSLLPQSINLTEVSLGLVPAVGLHLHKRLYTFKWIPLGAMPRLIARFQAHREFELDKQWRMGLLMHTKSGQRGLVNCTADYKSNTFQLTLVTCEGAMGFPSAPPPASPPPRVAGGGGTGRAGRFSHKALIHEAVSIVDAWILDLYSHPSVKRDVVCSHCMSTAPQVAPGVFQLEVVMQLFLGNKQRIPCGVCQTSVEIASIAPDVTFSFLPVLENVTMGVFLGRGGFANVYRGTMEDGTEVAVKELLVSGDEDAVTEQFRRFQHEVSVMARINHPMLVRLYGVMLQPRPRLVMEYCALPDLSQILYGKDPNKPLLSYAQKLGIGYDVALALGYLHAQQPPIVHRDVRSPNVFIVSLDPRAQVIAKLGDFGLAATVAPRLVEALSTFQWLAPEVLNGNHYDELVDIYSLSMVMVELVATRMPFTEYHLYFYKFNEWTTFYCALCGEDQPCQQTPECPANQREKTETGEKLVWKEQRVKDAIVQQNLRPTIPPYCPADLVALIKAGWSRDCGARPSAAEYAERLLRMYKSEDGTAATPRMGMLTTTIERDSSGNLSLENAAEQTRRVLVSKPYEIERSDDASCVVRVERALWVGHRSGELSIVHLWGLEDDLGGSSATGLTGSDVVTSAGPEGGAGGSMGAGSGSSAGNAGVGGGAGGSSSGLSGASGSGTGASTVATEKVVKTFTAHAGSVTCMLHLWCHEVVWSASEDGTVFAWAIPAKRSKPAKKKYALRCPAGAGAVSAIVETSTYVVIGHETGMLCVWEPGERDATLLATNSELRTPIYSLCMSDSMFETIVFVGSMGKVHLFNEAAVRKGQSWAWFKMLSCEESLQPVRCLAVVDKDLWASCGKRIFVYNVRKFELRCVLESDCSGYIVSMLPVSSHNSMHVWISARDDRIRVWDTRRREEYLELTCPRSVIALLQLSLQCVVSLDANGSLLAWPFV